jgi:hypothetical protein
MDAFRRIYERGVTKLRRIKKKIKDAVGSRAPRSASVSRVNPTGDGAQNTSSSGHPRASMNDTTVRQDAISRGTTSPFSNLHPPIPQLRVDVVEPDTEISNVQSPSDATHCEYAHSMYYEAHITE